jgi:hypothetical protein
MVPNCPVGSPPPTAPFSPLFSGAYSRPVTVTWPSGGAGTRAPVGEPAAQRRTTATALTWPRSGAADRTLTVPVPALPAADLLLPALRPAVLRRVLTYAEPVVGTAASAAGAGAAVQLALPFVMGRAQQAPCDTSGYTA